MKITKNNEIINVAAECAQIFTVRRRICMRVLYQQIRIATVTTGSIFDTTSQPHTQTRAFYLRWSRSERLYIFFSVPLNKLREGLISAGAGIDYTRDRGCYPPSVIECALFRWVCLIRYVTAYTLNGGYAVHREARFYWLFCPMHILKSAFKPAYVCTYIHTYTDASKVSSYGQCKHWNERASCKFERGRVKKNITVKCTNSLFYTRQRASPARSYIAHKKLLQFK